VRLLDGPFANAMRVDLAYVRALDPDRLLAPYLREAGLSTKAPSYGNWESSGLDGHTAGHYLSALAHLHAATGEDDLRRRLDYMVDELARAQTATGTGYVGGVPAGAALFESLRTGGIAAARSLGSSEHWVPWYNLHKVYQGLIDAHRIAGSERALEVATRLADWWLDIAAEMSDEAFEAMLDTEFGGMNESYAALASLTGRADYAAMARRFSHRAVLDPLLAGRDELTGLHANTQIAKAVGYAATAAVTSDRVLLAAADFFWRTVVDHRSVAIGGNSVREHFHDPADFTSMIDDREGPETCNTYHMLRLTRELAQAGLRPEHLDYAERAIFNHLLASQHPARGGFVYFTSMRPRHYRVYSVVDQGFWCCVGTGMEAQARFGEWVFGVEDCALAVNLPVAAELDAPQFGGRIRLDTSFPLDDRVTLTFDLVEPGRFALRLRVPGWSGGLTDLTVNGVPAAGSAVRGALVLERHWRPGDTVAYRLPLAVRAERLPDGSAWQAYLAGPVVLAARAGGRDLTGLLADERRMGHVAAGRLLPLADLPIVRPGAGDLTPTGPLRYRLSPLSGAPVDLEPFSGIHDCRYTVYWPVAGDPAARRAELGAMDDGLTLDGRTLDAVVFGEQQPESDHEFSGTDTTVSVAGGRHWRVTRDRMSVVLHDSDGLGGTLRVGLRILDAPTRVVVRLAGTTIADEAFAPGDEFVDLDYGVAGVLAEAGNPGRVTLEFAAVDGRLTPGVTTVRLLCRGG
jgi:DUF1680 family protein